MTRKRKVLFYLMQYFAALYIEDTGLINALEIPEGRKVLHFVFYCIIQILGHCTAMWHAMSLSLAKIMVIGTSWGVTRRRPIVE